MAYCPECKKTVLELRRLYTPVKNVKRMCCPACHERITAVRREAEKNRK